MLPARTCKGKKLLKRHVFKTYLSRIWKWRNPPTWIHFFLIHIWKFRLNCSTQLSLCYQKHTWKPKEVLENNLRHCHSQWRGEQVGNYYLWLTVKSHWINMYKNHKMFSECWCCSKSLVEDKNQAFMGL